MRSSAFRYILVSTSAFAFLVAMLAQTCGPAWASGPPLFPDPCTTCAFQPATELVVNPGAAIVLTGAVGSEDYLHAILCGDLACVYPLSQFSGIAPPLSVGEDCGQYAGLDGPPTRPFNGTPGSCDVLFDPPAGDIVWPGSYYQVEYVHGVGSTIQDGTSFLIGMPVEIYRLEVTGFDPETFQTPAVVFAVKKDADPVMADCDDDVWTDYLPSRDARDCVAFQKTSPSTYYNPVPDGEWDVLAFNTSSPVGKLRTASTPWKAKAIVMAGSNQEMELERIQTPKLSITAELLGNDDEISVNEDAIVHVVVSASDGAVEGGIKSIGFINSNPILQEGPSGGGTIAKFTPAPAPPYGFTLAAGEKREFDVPIRGTTTGNVNLRAKTFGISTRLFEDRNATQELQIRVTDNSPPVPPTFVCGFDVATYVASTSTGPSLQVESTAGIGIGAELVVNPCAPNAEQVTVTAIQGTTLTVDPAMLGAHVAKEPVVVLASGETILKSASAPGAEELDVLRSDVFEVDDHITIDPGTAGEETTTVSGFGSILVDPALQNAHETGARIVAATACATSCGDANGDDAITASDALLTLRTAVGLRSCAICTCDANSSSKITAADALAILRFAVGSATSLNCPAA